MSKRDVAKAIAIYYLKQAADEKNESDSRKWDKEQAEWRRRAMGNIERWVEQHNVNVQRIDKADENLESLRERLSRTKNAEQIVKIKGWIAEGEAKIEELGKRNIGLKEKIESVTDKLKKGAEPPWYYQGGNRHGSGVSLHLNRIPELKQTKREVHMQADHNARRTAVPASEDSIARSAATVDDKIKSLLGLWFGR